MPSNEEIQQHINLFGAEEESQDEEDNSDSPQQPIESKKPSPAFDDSRKLFQRLWTDEDEVSLLRGFLDYRTQRGGGSSNPSYHIDTSLFYDQIKSQLQLDFNKNQLIDKLRRLKKKYRNAVSRITSGKDFTFKTPHDKTTFEIAHNIWGGSGVVEEELNGGLKRSRDQVEEDESAPTPASTPAPAPALDVSGIRDAIRSCVSPLLKELVYFATNGQSSCFGDVGGDNNAMVPPPMYFGGNFARNGEAIDEKWRKQQILELEVYLKRVELVQDQIKLALEELKSHQ